ncbi:MAG: hypothetical protein A2152_03450 [Candidatus Levybacteria bacterium RBG_16_35_6]|nr:MAG: hypothetical protein A2152_03450 [Candidatus Levybacteria bacterium RBG_16_35_6]
MVIFFIILGLFVGSFLNLVIDRLPKSRTITEGRSKCDFCDKELKWFELIPLLSFIIQKRRCRYCHKKLSFYYPLIELTTGILFGLSYLLVFTFPLALIFSLIIVSFLIIIFFTDLKYGIIPDQIILVGSIVTLFYLILNNGNLVINNLLSGLIAFLFFLILIIITKGKGMGMGDAKFVFMIGVLLGPHKTIISIYLAFLTGATISIILILLGIKKIKKDTIPFGPFLAGCTLLTYFFGNNILAFLLNIFNF